jgi:glycosyltransferase involved in cell wall biosynthesis
VHEWLTTYAGSERVLREILAMFPDADLFTVVDFLSDRDRATLFGPHPPRKIHTSFIQRMPFARRKYRSYLPLMPLAIEQFDLSGYDLVISSNHAVAKGVLTGPDQTHICYCHSPIRYAWDLQHQYLRESGLVRGPKSALARGVLHYMRLWDVRTANGVDQFVANSAFIGRRIRKTYGRAAQVIHPPVDTAAFALRHDKEDFYLTASRLVQYKRIDLIVAAFASMPDRRLLVLGDGPEMQALRDIAGANVTFLGYQPDVRLIDYLQRARAFIFAAEEDFGILPIEAQSCGTPVIAYGRGGVLETIRSLDHEAPTGVFFAEQTAAAIIDAVARFEAAEGLITADACRVNAETFGVARFHAEFRALVAAA